MFTHIIFSHIINNQHPCWHSLKMTRTWLEVRVADVGFAVREPLVVIFVFVHTCNGILVAAFSGEIRQAGPPFRDDSTNSIVTAPQDWDTNHVSVQPVLVKCPAPTVQIGSATFYCSWVLLKRGVSFHNLSLHQQKLGLRSLSGNLDHTDQSHREQALCLSQTCLLLFWRLTHSSNNISGMWLSLFGADSRLIGPFSSWVDVPGAGHNLIRQRRSATAWEEKEVSSSLFRWPEAEILLWACGYCVSDDLTGWKFFVRVCMCQVCIHLNVFFLDR